MSRPTLWTDDRKQRLTELWPHHTGDELAKLLGAANRGVVYREAKAIGLPAKSRGRKKIEDGKRRVPYVGFQRRIPSAKPGLGRLLPGSHPAVREGRTLFPGTVRNARGVNRVLKTGWNQRKVGRRVTKGRWKGMEIYCLTLEERKTCPRSCSHWRDCYGNNMHLAERIERGVAFENRLWRELEALQAKHPAGFVVRLHILGDFYSIGYVGLWARALNSFPALHVYGYTARQKNTPIGRSLLALSLKRWDRFAMRFSGYRGERGATTFERDQEPTGIACPAQTGASECCATCALCWSTTKEISFESHGHRGRGPAVFAVARQARQAPTTPTTPAGS